MGWDLEAVRCKWRVPRRHRGQRGPSAWCPKRRGVGAFPSTGVRRPIGRHRCPCPATVTERLWPGNYGYHCQPATHELRTEWVYRSHRAAGKDQRFNNQQSILDRRGRRFSSDRWVCGHRVATGAILREPGHSVRSRGHVHNDLLDQYFGYPSGPPQESHALLRSFRQCPGGTRRFGGGGNPARVGRFGALGAGSRSCGAGTNAIHWGVDAMSMDSQPSEAGGRHGLDGKVRIEYLCEVLLALLWTEYG